MLSYAYAVFLPKIHPATICQIECTSDKKLGQNKVIVLLEHNIKANSELWNILLKYLLLQIKTCRLQYRTVVFNMTSHQQINNMVLSQITDYYKSSES